jgi:hypothetical protein
MRSSNAQRLMAFWLCAALLLPLVPQQAAADDGRRVIIEIGQPSVWSLGQAHYLLSKMHRTNRKLNTRFPTAEDLDSNRIAATRIEAMRRSIGVEGQFDQGMGVRNDIAMRRLREGEARRETARADLTARQAELQRVNGELADLNEQIAVLEEDDRQSTEARGRATPPAPPTAEDNERKREIVRLKVRKARKEEERTELKGQITSLTTAADTAPATPTFESPALSTASPTLPNPDAFKDFMKKAVDEAGKPDLSASMKLDNFVQMQYEIISKQLTLLRDEVGPEDRVIFFELPASIYTVDKKADDYVAQVEWEVETVCDREPPVEIQERIIRRIMLKEGKTEEQADEEMMRIDKVRWHVFDKVIKRRANRRLSGEEGKAQLELFSKKLTLAETSAAATAEMMEKEKKRLFALYEEQERKYELGRRPAPYPITLDMIAAYEREGERDNPPPCEQTGRTRARAIDIIPRQSALNVNERHAVVKETMILAAFKFLIGFAGRVNFQRQRELYEQFVQQQVFASGYGKGDDRFGWTYGPQPGTRRIAPGLRTTFAVLVVPRNTLAVRLKARSRYYKRHKSPVDPEWVAVPLDRESAQSRREPDRDVVESSAAEFFLSVPGKRTQEFWVDGVSYTAVRKGRRVTAIIDGNYFSPQLGIMVNGVPLEPVLSISRIAGSDEEADVTSTDGIVGEYEVTNSRQIVLSFKMPDDYVGTPTITFTSPEKSTPLNFFDLNINHRGGYASLQETSFREPMFMDEFSVGKKLEPINVAEVCAGIINDATLKRIKEGKFGLARLSGTGLRPSAGVSINNIGVREIGYRPMTEVCEEIDARPEREFAMQDSTRAYILYFKARSGPKRRVAYRQPTRQGYEEDIVTEDFSQPTIKVAQRRYGFNPAARRGEVDLTFTPSEKGAFIEEIVLDDPADGRCLSFRREGTAADGYSYRVKCLVPADNGGRLERDFITVRLTFRDKDGNQGTIYEDITLPVRPQVFAIVNPRTGSAAGFVEEEPTVIISGVNLQGVTSVFFGDKEAKLTAAASPDSVAVKVPKGAPVPKGQAAAVPVVLKTSGGQQVPSGAVYTYVGEPPTPNVIVWPYPSGRSQP